MAYKYLNDDGLKAYTKKVKGALKDLHTPIAISTENTTESMEQNVKNIADFVAKAKAAGIADVNGMAVSCIMDNDYSAVLAFYSESDKTQRNMFGVSVHDDPSEQIVIRVSYTGYYTETPLVTPQNTDIITSEMLTQGARKPIILTPETTEVDEETYQKLLSDDVDVVFKTYDGNYCVLTYKEAAEGDYYFTTLSVENMSLADTFLYGYRVSINDTAPHEVTIGELYADNVFNIIKHNGFIYKSILKRVLQEIDLTGTDAERKARLDEFEADWKALTGASDLTGARFVGFYDGYSGIFFMANETYMGYCSSAESNEVILTNIDVRTGSASYISVSSQIVHLIRRASAVKAFSAIELKASDNAFNKAALTAYKKILTNALTDAGINITNGYSVPVRITGNTQEYHGMLNIGTGTLLSGIVTDVNETHHYPFNVSTSDGAITFDANNYFLEKTSNEVTEMLDAIKYSYTPVPLTATTSTNKTQLDLFLSKVPNAQVMHCTYKDVYAGTLHKINGSWYGALVGESNTLAGQLSIKLQADGTIVEGTA